MIKINIDKKRRWSQINKGQAILELAIFGSILIMLLGILINYGLRYNFQQQLIQQTFRKAMGAAANSTHDGYPISVNYQLVQDKHIPDPRDVFGLGSVIPISTSSVSVVRNWQMHKTPDTPEELPQIDININGQTFSYKTAGFRDELDVSQDDIDRYKEIYGDSNVWVTEEGAACLRQEINPQTGVEDCVEYSKNIRIIDPGIGQVFDYTTARRICNQLQDKSLPPPAYCAEIESLFASIRGENKSFGLQSDYVQASTGNNILTRSETNSGITTGDTINWQDATRRNIIYKEYGDTSNTLTQPVTSTVSQDGQRTWQANW